MPAQAKAQVEQSLSDLAIAEVGAKLPKLMQHLVGFEVVECNDESTRAAGILAFDLGGSLVYSPVLFLNGRIKAATDTLYLSDSDVFTSASPAWVEYLSSRGTGVTGKAQKQPVGAGAVPYDALRLFNRPPQVGGSGKQASASPSIAETEGWGSQSKLASALPCEFKELFTWWTRPEVINKTASRELTIPNALRSLGPKGYKNFISQLVTDYPDVLEKYAQFHDIDELKVEFTPEEIASANPIVKVAALEVPKLSFIDFNSLSEYPDAFDTNQKTAVLETGLGVIDKRAEDEKSKVYDDDYVGKFCSPTESGFHSIFNDQGNLEKVYIGLNPFFLTKPDKKLPAPMIVDAAGGSGGDGAKSFYIPKDGEAILCRTRLPLDDEGFMKSFEKMTKLESASKTSEDNRYVAISPSGVMSAPFEVRNVVRQDGNVTLACHTDDDMEKRLLIPPMGPEATGPDDVTFVRLVDSLPGSERIRTMGGMVYIPKTYRVMKVKKLDADDYSGKIRPGSIGLLGNRTGVGMGQRKLETKKEASGRYILRQSLAGVRQAEAVSRPLLKNAALKLMIGNLNFDETNARTQLDQADLVGSAQCWFVPPTIKNNKTAQLLTDTPFPVNDDQHDTDEQGRPVQYPAYGSQQVGQDRMPVPSPDDQPDGPGKDPAADALGAGFQRINKSDMDLVMKASEGDGSVFDAGMFGAILRTNRVEAQIDSYLPDLVGALDKLARNLLLLYWKQSDISALFGSDQMAQCEDTLLQGIKVLGEIVLFYKQKATESSQKKVDAFD